MGLAWRDTPLALQPTGVLIFVGVFVAGEFVAEIPYVHGPGAASQPGWKRSRRELAPAYRFT